MHAQATTNQSLFEYDHYQVVTGLRYLRDCLGMKLPQIQARAAQVSLTFLCIFSKDSFGSIKTQRLVHAWSFSSASVLSPFLFLYTPYVCALVPFYSFTLHCLCSCSPEASTAGSPSEEDKRACTRALPATSPFIRGSTSCSTEAYCSAGEAVQIE